MTENKQRVLIYHNNPFGDGISWTWVWCTPFDGELTEVKKKYYEDRGWTFTYEDVGPFPEVDTSDYDRLFGFDTKVDITTVGEYIID